MSTVRPPAAISSPAWDLLASDEPGHTTDQSPVFEGRNALDELPQGALMLLAQLQPLRERPLKLSLAPLRQGVGTESKLANVSMDQAMHWPMKQPSVPSSQPLRHARLALADRFPITAQVLVQVSVTRAFTTPDQAVADVSAEHKAPLSATRIPLAVQTPVPDQTAVADRQVKPEPPQAIADRQVKPEPPQAIADRQVKPEPPQAIADRLVQQEASQALPALPLPMLGKSSYFKHPTRLSVPAKATPEPNSAPEVSTARGAANYLQVPFSKGDAVGLITVSKARAERSEPLLLSPSSASIFTHLSDNLAQAPDPCWRLTDQQGHESRHGREQAQPDEEVEEQSRQALRDGRGRGEQQT